MQSPLPALRGDAVSGVLTSGCAVTRVFNIYLISTKGVLPGKDIERCLQCAPRCKSALLCVPNCLQAAGSALHAGLENRRAHRSCYCFLVALLVNQSACFSVLWLLLTTCVSSSPVTRSKDPRIWVHGSPPCRQRSFLCHWAPGPCDDDPNRGGFSCCKTCNTTTPGPAIGYRFEYNVTYRRAPRRCEPACVCRHGYLKWACVRGR